jgi:hypothetical protein
MPVKVDKIAALPVSYPNICDFLRLRNDLVGCRTLIYSDVPGQPPQLTLSRPPGPDPHFPMVFNRMITQDILERKLVWYSSQYY